MYLEKYTQFSFFLSSIPLSVSSPAALSLLFADRQTNFSDWVSCQDGRKVEREEEEGERACSKTKTVMDAENVAKLVAQTGSHSVSKLPFRSSFT